MTALAQQPWSNAYAQRFKTPEQRFHEKYLINPETGCWESGANLALVRACRTCRDAAEARHVAKQRRERAA